MVNFLIWTGLVNRISSVFRLASTNHSEVISRLTQNKDLQALSAYLFYGGKHIEQLASSHDAKFAHFTSFLNLFTLFFFLGVPPKESSFLINALLLHHYKRGAYYPRGGASEFAFHMIPVIQQGGGNVLVRAPVNRVLLDQEGKACGKGMDYAF